MEILKKITILVMSCAFAISLILTSCIVEANHLNSYYPEDYLDGNPDFPCIWVHMNTAWFVDKNSLVSEQYEPPYYTLSIEGVQVHYEGKDATEISRKRFGPVRYYYDYNNKEMYVIGTSGHRFVKPHGANSESGVIMHIGEAAFYMDYNMRFYGAQKMLNPNFGKYMEVFKDEFYEYL